MNIFVTGITGNVGSAVVERLLKLPDVTIWALIRGRSVEDADERLRNLLGLWRLSDNETADASERIRLVLGDIGLPRFGLDSQTWDAVVADCSYLVHAAGVVRMNLPIEEARRYAVGAAENLIGLAEAIAGTGRSVDVAFVSTVGVAGTRQTPLRDEWVTERRGFHNTYEQAKAEAEDRLRAWDRGARIRLSVHRPSMVVGGSDGQVLRHQIFYYLCEFLTGRHTYGLQPRMREARLDTVPVDYVADAICWAVTHPESDGRIFNLCSGPHGETPLSMIRDWAREALIQNGNRLPPVRSLPIPLFLTLIRSASLLAPREARRRLATLPVLLGYLKSPQIFDGQATRDFLSKKAELDLPAPTDYLHGIVSDFFR